MIITGAINHRHSFRMMRCLVLFLCFLSIGARRRVEENESAEVDEDLLRNAGANAAGNAGGNAAAIPPTTTMSSTSTQNSGGNAGNTGNTGNTGSNTGNTGGNTGNTAQNLKCTFPDHYCNPTAEDLIRKVEDQTITDAAHCKRLCAE